MIVAHGITDTMDLLLRCLGKSGVAQAVDIDRKRPAINIPQPRLLNVGRRYLCFCVNDPLHRR